MKTYDERIASVQQKLHRRRVRRRVVTATALMLCVCIIAGVLFMPYDKTPPEIQMYADSDYYEVIKAISSYTYQPPKYDNLFDELVYAGVTMDGVGGNLTGGVPEAQAPGASPDHGMSAEGSADSSVEITDHQVAGVLEADIIKRSQTHIFYLKGNLLEVYPIAGEETERISTWKLSVNLDSYYTSAEMYLSADATRLHIVAPGFGKNIKENGDRSFVQVISLDVSDPTNIKELESIYITGSLLSSRMVGEQMLLMARYWIDANPDFEDESTFLPQIGTPGNLVSVPADNIIIPDKLDNRYYTVVVLLDGNDMSLIDSGAFMSASTDLYVSKERIYTTRSYGISEKLSDTLSVRKTMTAISCMSYGAEGLTNQGTFCVEGTVKDQYSMDEYNGIFRVVTGTSRNYQIYSDPAKATVDAQGNTAPPDSNALAAPQDSRNANLTCFKVGTWEQVAQVEQFAPDGETVESVRFDGDHAYVCTAVVVTLTDPVFFFDMSDLDNIIVKDTGTIDGFSSSLIQLKDGFLMGIGLEARQILKVEIYEETATGVAAVCEYVQSGNVASNYKAYYIDRENNLFGIPTTGGYILLHFDGCQLRQLANAGIIGMLEDTRGVVIDDYLYVFSNVLRVQKIEM